MQYTCHFFRGIPLGYFSHENFSNETSFLLTRKEEKRLLREEISRSYGGKMKFTLFFSEDQYRATH